MGFLQTILKDPSLVLGNKKLFSPFYLKKAFSVLFYAIRGTRFASKYGPIRMQIEITDICNFNCVMCDRRNLKNIRELNHNISYKKFKNLINEIRPLYVTLNGLGEPLFNKDIFKFLKLCGDNNITTSMPTNMSLMNEENRNQLVKYPPSILTFSLHGTTHELFEAITESSTYEKCIHNFEALLSKIDRGKTDVRILFVLQSKNLEEYNPMYKFLKKWKLLDSFRLEPVFDFVPNQKVVPEKEEIEHAIEKLNFEIKKCKNQRKKSFLIEWKNKLLELFHRKKLQMTVPCLTPWISTYITATGNVLPCCYLTSEKYIMGNINKKPFRTIWNGKRYQAFRGLLINSRKNIMECYRCFWDDKERVKRYRPITLYNCRWNPYI
ncbi:MAG: radical SAM/SPASM domain-containing protein [Promethearchaeota archaeon]|nr:MAG: radical SAM/SPASM domain-containing protein [Candidatus Lokiarchaeota archaeon]